jgi:hypothetical protein
MGRTLRAGEALFFSKEEAERREISCEGDGVWAKLGSSKGRGPTKQWNVVFEDETEKWMMDSDIYAFVKTDTRGQIEVHSSDSENERRQLEQEEDSDAAGDSPETTEETAMTKRAYDYKVNQELHDLVESAYPDGWMTAGHCIDIEQLQVQH